MFIYEGTYFKVSIPRLCIKVCISWFIYQGLHTKVYVSKHIYQGLYIKV